MSQENVETVRRAYAAWDSGDLAACLATFDERLVIHPIIGPDWHGPEGVLGMAADWIEGLEDWSMVAEEFTDAGDRVVARVHQTGVGEGSRVPVESDYWFVYTLSGGKIVRWDMYADRGKALEAAGLEE